MYCEFRFIYPFPVKKGVKKLKTLVFDYLVSIGGG